ncbi:MAG: 50S ribosomal protein L16 [Planctomycetota bacterium]|jgi:large subunit ribosomal protein L16|nr:50S ribosomal protein L16 [Planctomycetota bacterium]
MALMPKRVKYRKCQRGKIRGNATRGNEVAFGDYGLQVLEPGWIRANQIEAGRVAANRYMAGEGRVWIRIFPHKPVSAKPAETRMGKGKGEPSFYVAVVKPGTILYEVAGVPEDVARDALARTAHKMPLRVRLVKRKHKM